LFTIPVGGDILETHGAKALICFFSLALLSGVLAFALARWAYLERKWAWLDKV
jgi:hypothetical protein